MAEWINRWPAAGPAFAWPEDAQFSDPLTPDDLRGGHMKTAKARPQIEYGPQSWEPADMHDWNWGGYQDSVTTSPGATGYYPAGRKFNRMMDLLKKAFGSDVFKQGLEEGGVQISPESLGAMLPQGEGDELEELQQKAIAKQHYMANGGWGNFLGGSKYPWRYRKQLARQRMRDI